VLPLQFADGENAASLGLDGSETFAISGIADDALAPGVTLRVVAEGEAGAREFDVLCRIDSPLELSYYRHGGILPFVLRQMLASGQEVASNK
jgi:aconitate hydratase